MQQKMRSTVIRLKSSQLIAFQKVISYTKFGYNALFQNVPTDSHLPAFYDVYAFSTSLLHINNLKNHLQQTLKLYNRLNNPKILAPVLQTIQDKDTLYLVSKVQRHSLKQLIERREGLTQYQVTYFAMELFEILTYCKSRDVYFEKLELDNLYLNEEMKLSLPFNMFLNTPDNKPLMKRLPFRHEAKNRNVCPELFWTGEKSGEQSEGKGEDQIFTSQQKNRPSKFMVNVHMVNSWNLGVTIYELFENCKPFETACAVPILGHSSNYQNEGSYHDVENKKFYGLKFCQTESQEARALIGKLLQVDVKKRLNFPLVLIEAMFKKIGQVPHILPSTILTCPPSEEFKQSYMHSFPKHGEKQLIGGAQSQPQRQNVRSLKKRNEIVRTQIIQRSNSSNHIDAPRPSCNVRSPVGFLVQPQPSVMDPARFRQIHQTQKYIKASQRSLTQNKIYVEEFVDISHVYGFGYQMNTGTLCFVFNDETEFYFPNSNRKYLVYLNDKKYPTFYTYDKLPEEEDLKKKIFILEAYSKSIKKFKTPTQSSSTHQKTTTVLRYGRTKHASMFHLSNDTVQVFFNDKICFLSTRSNLYVLSKNTDKYEKYDYRNETNQMKTRREYVTIMAKKIFGWNRDRSGDGEEVEGDEDSALGYKKLGMDKKESLLVDLGGENISEGHVQSLKKAKQKQDKNFHMFKKPFQSRDKNQDIIFDHE